MTDLKAEFLDEFWPDYPKKAAKMAAMDCYIRARKGQLRLQKTLGTGSATKEEILAGLPVYRATKPDYADWMHATTFLNRLEWMSEGGSEVVEPKSSAESHLEWKRREHESGQCMHVSLAAEYGWAEFGSVRLRVVG